MVAAEPRFELRVCFPELCLYLGFILISSRLLAEQLEGRSFSFRIPMLRASVDFLTACLSIRPSIRPDFRPFELLIGQEEMFNLLQKMRRDVVDVLAFRE